MTAMNADGRTARAIGGAIGRFVSRVRRKAGTLFGTNDRWMRTQASLPLQIAFATA